jgi:hypothetical protein
VKKICDDWFIFGKLDENLLLFEIPDKYKTHIVDALNQYDPKKRTTSVREESVRCGQYWISNLEDDVFHIHQLS